MKSDITINDINLVKFYKCQQRGMLSMKRTSVFDLRNEVSGKNEMFRIPNSFVEHDLLKYKIYKSIFFKMFQTLFKEKKVNYSQLKRIAILITEKTITNNKKLASNLTIKQEDYDEVKQHIFNNLENLINLFLDKDLENSFDNCFKIKIKISDYLEKRINEMKNPYIINNLPKIDFNELSETNFNMDYHILSLNKIGDNLADIILMSPFMIAEEMKQKYFWISNLFHYFNKQLNEPKYNKYFLDNWFAINSIIVYNPLTMKRIVYYFKDFDHSFPDLELMKIISIIQNKIQIKNFYENSCDYCEARRTCCEYYTSSKNSLDRIKEQKDYDRIEIKL